MAEVTLAAGKACLVDRIFTFLGPADSQMERLAGTRSREMLVSNAP